jgi:membrane protein required for colicin V production
MGIVDIVILICFIPSLFIGFKNGCLKQVVAILAIILGVYLSSQFSEPLSQWMTSHWFQNSHLAEEWIKLISFIIIFIIVAALVGLIGALTGKVLQIDMLEWLDKLLGIVLCIAQCALLFSLIIFLVDSLNNLTGLIPRAKIAESKIYPWLLSLAGSIFPYLKHFFHS